MVSSSTVKYWWQTSAGGTRIPLVNSTLGAAIVYSYAVRAEASSVALAIAMCKSEASTKLYIMRDSSLCEADLRIVCSAAEC